MALPVQAICWAWELSTEVFGLPVDRVWVSVYEEDEESLVIWRDVVGVAPDRIRKMGAEDNFWASGPTGGQREEGYDGGGDDGGVGGVGSIARVVGSSRLTA